MFKQLLNSCELRVTVASAGPLLIKSGLPTVIGPDMTFVRTRRAGAPQIYLPGSSLKGAIRAQAERIVQTIWGLTDPRACDPFERQRDEPSRACGDHFDKDFGESGVDGQTAYRESCLICRLFGSTGLAGRLSIEDASLANTERLEQRDGVGIDRFTGGSAYRAKFDLEVAVGAQFATRLGLRNFELWQLGLLGLVLRDLTAGQLRLGSGKSRGLGAVTATIDSVELRYFGRTQLAEGQIAGLAAQVDDAGYGFSGAEREPSTVAGLTFSPNPLDFSQRYLLNGPDALLSADAASPFWQTVVGRLRDARQHRTWHRTAAGR